MLVKALKISNSAYSSFQSDILQHLTYLKLQFVTSRTSLSFPILCRGAVKVKSNSIVLAAVQIFANVDRGLPTNQLISTISVISSFAASFYCNLMKPNIKRAV